VKPKPEGERTAQTDVIPMDHRAPALRGDELLLTVAGEVGDQVAEDALSSSRRRRRDGGR
jgi:hypothetical protein